jgi:hypothetical protein
MIDFLLKIAADVADHPFVALLFIALFALIIDVVYKQGQADGYHDGVTQGVQAQFDWAQRQAAETTDGND